MSGRGSSVSRQIEEESKRTNENVTRNNRKAAASFESDWRTASAKAKREIGGFERQLNSLASSANSVRRATRDMFPEMSREAGVLGQKVRNLFETFEGLKRSLKSVSSDADMKAWNQRFGAAKGHVTQLGDAVRAMVSDQRFKQAAIDMDKMSKAGEKLKQTLSNKEFAAIEANATKLDKLLGRGVHTGKFERSLAAGKYAGFSNSVIEQLRDEAKTLDGLLAKQGDHFGRSFWSSFRGAFIGILTGIGIGAVLSTASALGQQVVLAIQKGMELQQLKVGLAAVSTSALEANQSVRILEETAKATPGLLFRNAVEGQMRLQAVGFAAAETTDMLVGLSKVRMMSNATDEDFRAVILNLTQIKSLGRLTGDEIRETLGRMPAMATVFRKAFGTVDIKQIREMDLTSYEFFQRFNQALKEVPTRAETATSAFIHLQNSWTLAQDAFAQPILDPLKDFFLKLSVAIDENRAMFYEWGVEVGNLINLLKDLTNSTTLNALAKLPGYIYGSTMRSTPAGGLVNAIADRAGEWYTTITDPRKRANQLLLADAIKRGDKEREDELRRSGLLSDAEATIDQQIRALEEATRDATQKALLDMEHAFRGRRILAAQMQAESKAEQLAASRDLIAIEKDRIEQTFEIQKAERLQQIELSKDRIERQKKLQEDYATWLVYQQRGIAEKLAAERAKLEQARWAEHEYWQNENMKVDSAQYEESMIGRRGRVAGMRTDTIAGQNQFNRESFAIAMADLEQQKKQLRMRLQSDLLSTDNTQKKQELERQYNLDMAKLNASTATLAGQRRKQATEEALAQKYLWKTHTQLTETTGNPVFDRYIQESAAKYKVSPNLIWAMMSQESGFKPGARSHKGASGLMQLMPATAQRLGVTNIYDPKQNIEGGTKYMRMLLDMFGGDVSLALAGYNAGEGAVLKYGRKIPPYRETQEYVKKILPKFLRSVNTSDGRTTYGDRDFSADSDWITTNIKEAQLLETIAYYQQRGLTPDESLLSEINAYQVQKARETGVAQPTMRQTAAGFGVTPVSRLLNISRAAAAGIAYKDPTGAVLTPGMRAAGWSEEMLDRYAALDRRKAGFGREVREAKLGQVADRGNRLLDLDKEFDLILDISAEEESQMRLREQRNANAQATLDLQARILGFEHELTYALETQRTERKNEQLDLDKELNLLQNLSGEEEVRLEKARQRNQMVKGLGEVERDIAVLKQQSEDSAFVTQRRRLGALQEQLSIEQEIAQTEDQIANSGVNDQLYIRSELLKQQLEIRNEERDAIVRSQKAEVELNRTLEIRGSVIYADIMEHLATQKTMNEGIADDIKSIYDKAAGGLDSVIDKITGKVGGVGSNILKVGVRSILTNATRGVMDWFGLGSAMPKPASVPEKLDRQIDLLEKIEKNTNPVSPTNVTSVLSGGRGGGFGTAGNLLGILLGGRGLGVGPGGTATFNPAAMFSGGSGGGADVSRFLGLAMLANHNTGLPGDPTMTRTGGSRVGFGGFLQGLLGAGGLKGLRSNLAGMAPLLGLGLGSGLGGSSMLGSIMGGIGGLTLGGIGAVGLLGTSSGIFAAGGSLSFLTPLLTNPFTAVAAGALLVGALLLGKNKKRQQAEQIRTAIKGNAMAELDKILSAVRGRRMSGAEALAQADQIRQQYVDEVSKIKDKKTRNIALNELNPPNAVWHKLDQIKKAAEAADAADEREKRLLPEFAHGGRVRSVLDLSKFKRRSGRVPGLASLGDVVPSLLTANEVVLNQDHQRRIQMMAGHDVFSRAQVPGFNTGVAMPSSPAATSPTTTNGGPTFTFYVSGEVDANGMVKIALRSDDVKQEAIKVVNEGIKNKQIVT